MSQIEQWIQPGYVEEFRRGELARHRQNKPFTHAELPNFFREDKLQEILATGRALQLERSHRQGVAKNADWYWAAFANLSYIRFFLGPEMRQFLNQLIGASLYIKRGHTLQYNEFRSGSQGLPAHTDENENVGIVTLIQLSEGYQPGLGGELILYKREGNRILADKVVQPICNKLIMFKVSDISFHSVSDMKGEWTRRTITYDWLTKEQIRVSPTLSTSN